VLLISDNPSEVERVRAALRQAGIDAQVELSAAAPPLADALPGGEPARPRDEHAPRELEARLRSVLDNSPDAAYRRDLRADCYDYMSPTIECITGFTVEEMTDPHFSQVRGHIHPDDLPAVEATIGRALAEAAAQGRSSASIEYRFRRKDGIDIWLADHLVVLADETGRPAYRLGTVQDITERKRATADLEALLAVSASLTSTLELPALLTALVEQLRTVVEYDGMAIYLLEGNDLTVTEYVGPLPRHEALAIRLPLSETAGCREVIEQRHPVRFADLRADTPEARSLRSAVSGAQARLIGDCRSWLGVPLVAKGRPIGMLRLSHAEPDHFTEHQIRVATTVANHAALAIENAQLYERAQRIAALEERQRLARELHDSVSQALYGVGLASHTALRHLIRRPEKAETALRHVLTLAQTGLSDMRALILELRPELLAQEGLARAIARQAEALYQRRGVPITVDVCEEPDVPLDVKEALYRITQEAMANAAKHSLAKRIEVRIGQDGQRVRLEIADDGIGFDPRANYPGHLGLRSMGERSAQIGAKFSVRSEPGVGSVVRVDVQVRDRSAA
jgi:PAS domain S-box-containing protein